MRASLSLVAIGGLTIAFTALPVKAQVLDLLLSPKTIVDRAIEARSGEDIVEDNRIVLRVNQVMAELGTIRASTEIYEQHLLVTGIFNDRDLYERFERGVREVDGVKKIHWHVRYMSDEDQEQQKGEMIPWKEVLMLTAKVGVNLIGTRGVADVNFRTAVDAFSTVYLMGRARSQEEMKRAADAVRNTEGVKRVVNYAVVRP